VRKVLRDCCATIGKSAIHFGRTVPWERRVGRVGWVSGLAFECCYERVSPLFFFLLLHSGCSLFLIFLWAETTSSWRRRGKSKSNKHPVSIWGWGTKGTRTRKPGPKGPKNSNKMVVRERPRGKEKQAWRSLSS